MSRTYNFFIRFILLCSISILIPAVVFGNQNLFKDGVEYFNEGDYAAAAEAFRAAYAEKPNWKILYNVGQSEAAAKQYDLALESFETYLAQGGDEIALARREEILAELNRLRQMVGSIEVLAPEGAVIYVDGMKRGVAPLLGKLTVTAGIPHQLIAMRDGVGIAEKEFKIRGQDMLSIDLRDKPANEPVTISNTPALQANEDADVTPADVSDAEPSKSRSPLIVSGIVASGVGVGAIIAGIVTGLMTRDLDNQLKNNCPNGVCSSEFANDKQKMENLRTATNVLLISGGAVTATGISLLVTGLIKKRKKASQASIEPTIGSAALGLQIKGSF